VWEINEKIKLYQMINAFKNRFKGDGLSSRALRGVGASTLMVVGGHVLRFGSNLILTRLLFPEAFGLMALVQVVVMGLEMMSTFGLRASVIQNKRGDEPAFLNTAWTLQILRGLLLYGALWLLIPVFVAFYDQPVLAQVLPVAGLSLILMGLHSTKSLTVERHMQLGLKMSLTLLAQVAGLVAMSLLAWWLQSVWALVVGVLVQPLVALILYQIYLPGHTSRLGWDKSAVRDILKLGKYLFFSTIATYFIKQSDRAVLGVFIPIDLLGVYGIAYALAVLPVTLATTVADSVVFPLYRMHHPTESASNQANIFKARRLVAVGALAVTATLAFIGPWLVELLYDARYTLAGPIAVLLCLGNVPMIVLNGTMNAALSKGDSLRFMIMNVSTATCQLALVYLAVKHLGVIGAPLGVGLAQLLTYPLLTYFLRRYANWDFKGDAGLICAGAAVMGFACWLHYDRLLLLMP